MARNGTSASRPRGKGGKAPATRTSKNIGKEIEFIIPTYNVKDLPKSVRAALKTLYPKSKYI